MVVNYGYIRSKMWDEVERDIKAVSGVTRPAKVLLKVILETSQLTEDEIMKATECAINAGADFVKKLHRVLRGRRNRKNRTGNA